MLQSASKYTTDQIFSRRAPYTLITKMTKLGRNIFVSIAQNCFHKAQVLHKTELEKSALYLPTLKFHRDSHGFHKAIAVRRIRKMMLSMSVVPGAAQIRLAKRL